MIKAENIVAGYNGHEVIRDVSFIAGPGECILLCGANGSGKSTLMKTLTGAIPPLGGKLSSEGAMVFVPTGIPKVKGFSLKEFIRTACYRDTNVWGKPSREATQAIDEAVLMLGIEDLSDKDISCISDGEFQKACIASALARRADTILLDEPTAFLDVDSRMTVLRCLSQIAKEKNICVLFSSHDIHESAALCTRILGISREAAFLDSIECGKQSVLKECFESLSDLNL